jgi:transposase
LKVDNIDVEAMIKKVQELLAQTQNLLSALHAILDVLLLVVQLLVNRLTLYSRNNSKPPSSGPDSDCDKKPKDVNNKTGDQPGSVGNYLAISG